MGILLRALTAYVGQLRLGRVSGFECQQQSSVFRNTIPLAEEGGRKNPSLWPDRVGGEGIRTHKPANGVLMGGGGCCYEQKRITKTELGVRDPN